MASVVQKNGLKPLVNGGLMQHVDVNKVCSSHQIETLPIQQQPFQMYTSQQSQELAHHAVNGQEVFVQQEQVISQIPNQCTDMVVDQNWSNNQNSVVKNENNMTNSEEKCEQSETEVVSDCVENGEPSQEIEEPEIDIVINNVVCSFSVRCHLNLRQIALNGVNVEYRRENGMLTMKLRRPYTTASIWSSGKITCTGATSEDQAKIAARRFARCLQKLGFKIRFNNFRVVNVLGTCSMPFGIKITAFSEKHKEADYEPELHPGVTYKLKKPKATLKIFSTGSVTVTAPCVASVQAAIEYIFPLVYEFRKERSKSEIVDLKRKMRERRITKTLEELEEEEETPCEEEEDIEEIEDDDESEEAEEEEKVGNRNNCN